MPASTRPPKYSRQKRNGKPDLAYCRIDGKKVHLGNYGTPASKTKCVELLTGDNDKPLTLLSIPR